VLLLKIVISDYIVHIAPLEFRLEAVPGMAERESWYRTNWIAVEFALLYRWHDLIPATVRFGNTERDSEALRRNNAWLLEVGVDRVLLDASRQLAGRMGLGNTAAFLYEIRRLSIDMARTCQLQPYNAYRRHYGLDPIPSFEALTGDRERAAALREIYGDIEKLEWFVGIFAEDFGPDEMMGALLNTMVANDAFTQALTNPLLSKAVFNHPDTFAPEGRAIIDATSSLADIVVRNTGVTDRKAVGFKIRS
jgi:prostaglandin-endoperoxide synthase 2